MTQAEMIFMFTNQAWNWKSIRGMMLLSSLFMVLVMLPSPAVAGAGDPAVTIKSYQVTPSILLPGDQGTITITIANTAAEASQTESTVDTRTGSTTTTTTTRDITALVESVYMYGQGMEVIEGNFQQVGALGPGQSMTLTFLVRAPKQAGMYFPEVWIRIPEGTSVKYPIPVNVNSPIGIQKQAVLVLESTAPDSANPGEEIPVTLTVRNDGQLLAEDVTIRVRNVSTLVAPKGSDLYHLGLIGSGRVKTANLVFFSDKDTSPGLTQVPVTLQYTGVDGVVHTQETAINLVMKGQGEMGFVSVDTSPRRVSENQPFDLTIRIENTGTGEAKQVAATVDLPMTGTQQSFIGKIKPGNDAPAVFMLDGGKSGTYSYNASITYTDDLGTHTVFRQMSLRVIPSDSSGGLILMLLGVLGVGIVAYRFWYLPKKNGGGALPWVKKS
ncbi:MAG: S-layer protein [Methanomicrobiales archaeon]|nr:S-layer protein [Methanomicrobiales archaeon]